MNRSLLCVTENSIQPEWLTTRLLSHQLPTTFLGTSLVPVLWRLHALNLTQSQQACMTRAKKDKRTWLHPLLCKILTFSSPLFLEFYFLIPVCLLVGISTWTSATISLSIKWNSLQNLYPLWKVPISINGITIVLITQNPNLWAGHIWMWCVRVLVSILVILTS